MGVLSALMLILWGFSPVVLLSILAFLCPARWWHDENVDCPHLYHVIMGSYTLIVLVLKYFLIFGGFVRLDSDPFGAFVLWCFYPFLLFSVRPRDGEKSKNGQKHHRTKAPKDQHQGGQNPQKWENILRLQQSMCTIPWSHDTGVDNQHSRHAITWPDREKQKWIKAPQDESPKRIRIKADKTPKNEKIF